MLRNLALALALLPALSTAQALKIEKYKLGNGMTVILHEDHSQPLACVNIWYKVGSKDEPERRSGFAHLFEHLMFMGTQRVPNGQFDILMEKFGGSNNASTAEDRTNYYESGPSSILPTLLWLEADRLESLARDMDQKKLDLQREVVKNEKRQSYDNAPYGKAQDSINGLVFPKGHPYHTTVIGSMEDLDNATVGDVKDFFTTFYVPNNASMVVAGDFDPNAIKPLIASLFGTLPRQNDVVRKSFVNAPIGTVKRVTMVDQVEAPKTFMVWQSPAAYKPGDVEMNLAARVLSGGYTSRLYQGLVVDNALASDVSAYQQSLLLGSMFVVELTGRKGVDMGKLEAAADRIISKFAHSGPTAGELERQIAQVRFESLNGLQSLTQRADKLNEYEFYFGNPDSFAKEIAQYQKATVQGIRSVVARTLIPNSRVIIRVIPQATGPAQDPRDKQPENVAEKPFVFPLPSEFRLNNGILVRYWSKPDLPLTVVTARFGLGSAIDSPSKAGLANLTSDAIDEAAGTRDAAAFTDALDLLGAQLFTSADITGSTVSLNVATQNVQKAVSLMSDVIIRPKLAKDDFDRIRTLQIENLQNDDAEPGTVASKVGNRIFFGAGHPYANPVGGLVSTVKNISLQDVKSEYQRIYRPSNMTLYVASDLRKADVKRLLNSQFGSWKTTDSRPLPKPVFPPIPTSKQRLVIVDKPGAVQTVIRIMMPTESFSAPSRYALTELGVVFGGTFTSRINHNLREEKGYTYGAGLNYAFSLPASYIVASSSVRTDVTGPSLKEFMAEFEKIRSGDVSEVEAAKARNSIRVDAISAVGTRQGLIRTAITYLENGIPIAAAGRELANFDRVTSANLNAIAGGGLPIDRALIVLVGDKAEILKQISGLGLPDPEVVKP
jgi:zinc protease